MPWWFYTLPPEERVMVVADWNILQEEAAGKGRKGRRQPAADAGSSLATLQASKHPVKVTESAASFWLGQGLVHVS